MNKVRITIDVDLTSGDYELQFNNLSNPGVGIDYTKLYAVIAKVMKDVDKNAMPSVIKNSSKQVAN